MIDASGERVGRPLDALNFFLADVRDGLGPYLAIYLLTVQRWDAASIGVVMSVAGVAGILAQTPAGALIDRTEAKRALVIAAAVVVTLGSLALPVLPQFAPVAVFQALTGVAGSMFAPALAAITLGIVGPASFARRIGRNEAFNHGGNATAAAVAAGTAYLFGAVVVFWVMAVLAVASLLATLSIPARLIDHEIARGLAHDTGHEHDQPSGWHALLHNRPRLIFPACAVTFHVANAAMLPLVGQKLALADRELGTSSMAICIVAAQGVMVPIALLVGAKADVWGRKPILLAAFAVLAVRGALYPFSDSPYWLVGVQLLDGVGAGIFGALFPLVVADLTRATGRFNVGQGAVATAHGIGAALSASVAGLVVVTAGYSAAFLTLATIAGAGFALYLLAMPETTHAKRELAVPAKPSTSSQALGRKARSGVAVTARSRAPSRGSARDRPASSRGP